MQNSLAGGKDQTGIMLRSPTRKGGDLQDRHEECLKGCQVLLPTEIDYINAHAPSTPIGDASEMKALNQFSRGSSKLKCRAPKLLLVTAFPFPVSWRLLSVASHFVRVPCQAQPMCRMLTQPLAGWTF